MQCLTPPPCEERDQASGCRAEARAAAARAATRGDQHLGAEDALHGADPVEAGAVAPADRAPSGANRPRVLDRLEEPQIPRPHQERAVPVEPEFVAGLQMRAERRRAGCRHTEMSLTSPETRRISYSSSSASAASRYACIPRSEEHT